MGKAQVYEQEVEELNKLFQNAEEGQKRIVQGLIEDAAFLYAENHEIKKTIKEIGMIKFHPTNKSLQKQTEAGKQYLKNVNSYTVVIKVLFSILQKNVVEEDDGFDEFMKEMREKRGM